MLEEFKKHIAAKFSNLKEHEFLLACSGGLDSIVLAHLCHVLGLNYSIAHCNFKLRGKESDADEEFVKILADKYAKKAYVTSFKTTDYITENKVSLQVAARELRYDWFAQIMQENDIKTLVTAHHADDNLETFIINLSRGTGIEGLTGIPEKKNSISRPLLPFSRSEILNYAEEHKLDWREDQSNQETKYLRNKIRHKIVPELKELHPTFLANFINTQNYLSQTSVLLDGIINTIRNTIFKSNSNVFIIEISALQKLEPLEPYIYQLFKPYGFSDANAIIELFSSLSGKEIYSATHRLLKDRNSLLLQEIKITDDENYFISKGTKQISIPISLKFSVVETITKTNPSIIYVDADLLMFPLSVRKWKTGDYIHPFGMKGAKKLSKFYKDEKYSLIDKENQWLLCSEDKIVWIIGKRADERFKVTENTKKIIAIKHE